MRIILPNAHSLDEAMSEATYTHHQDSALATWTVNHPLGKRPSVTTVNSSGQQIFGDVTYSSDSQIVIAFASAETGKVYLN